ncbi:unnamed protein product [Camellia sinensis]
MRQRRSQTRQNFNKQEREVRRETSVTCDGSRRTPSFFALHACESGLTREAPAAALDRSRSHRRRSRSFLQALVRRAPPSSPLCRRLAFHALCSSLRRSLRSLRHRRPRPRVAPGMHMLPKLLLYRFTFSSQCPGRRPTYEFPHPLARVPQSTGYWPLEDPKKTMDIILEALKNTGQRGIICRGWGDLVPEVSDSVFPLEDCPHDWLFPQCLAVLYMPGNTTQMHSFVMHFKVTDLCDRSLKGNGIVTNVQVHHGSAGTTATGLRAGVDFFFFFWYMHVERVEESTLRRTSVRAWFHCHRRRACHGCRPIISGLHLHNCNDCPEAHCMVFATRNSFRLVAPGTRNRRLFL